MNVILKQQSDSAQLFFDVLFRYEDKTKQAQDDGESNLHNQEGESIRGTEMKTLYEKFCFFNGYLEKKLDDPENLKLLKERGFKLEVKQDAMTECYSFIKFQEDYSLIFSQEQVQDSSKTSLHYFIEHCCQQTKFDTDYIEADVFLSVYQDFCILNHMRKVNITENDLKLQFAIQISYKPQQWIVRDSSQLQ